MSNNVRLAIGIVGAALLAVLATPEVAAKLPPGASQLLAAAIAAVLHKMNDKQLPPPPGAPAPAAA